MIDFKKALKDAGVTARLTTQRPMLPAMQSDVGSDFCNQAVHVEFEIARKSSDLNDDWWLYIYGGPTGYESANLIRLLTSTAEDPTWVACFGSDRYRRMEIKLEDIRRAVANYTVQYRFELL